MLSCETFYHQLKKINIDFFSGVPDSLLQNFCAFIEDTIPAPAHIIAANEGNAVALAAGHYLATGNPGLVYMQNSGQGNSINPLVSLADPEVYGIPMLLLIGWRGEPGKKDEPQHIKQGKITAALMQTLDIPYSLLPESAEAVEQVLAKAEKILNQDKRPYALIVKSGIFDSYTKQKITEDISDIEREDAIKSVCAQLDADAIIVATTGKISRELYEYRVAAANDHGGDFLTVGSMGHASQIALGIACAKKDKQIFCFDGDGAVIMHMGGMGIIGSLQPKNFRHIIFNNSAHDSVGGQPTIGSKIDFTAIAKACGYKTVFSVKEKSELMQKIHQFKVSEGPALLEIRVKKGARPDLGRPKEKPVENKLLFMKKLGSVSGSAC